MLLLGRFIIIIDSIYKELVISEKQIIEIVPELSRFDWLQLKNLCSDRPAVYFNGCISAEFELIGGPVGEVAAVEPEDVQLQVLVVIVGPKVFAEAQLVILEAHLLAELS